jgi:hypothetical protein
MRSETTSGRAEASPKPSIFSAINRGRLIDILIFIANLYLMRLLSRRFVELFSASAAGDQFARFAVCLFFLGLLVLPALGATLKRWRLHERRKASGKSSADFTGLAGCLFNPLISFALNLMIAMAVAVFAGEQISSLRGKDLQNDGAVFLPLIFAALAFAILQTVLIYRYFSAPTGRPLTNFFLKPQSEYLGDVCLFLHMLLFQVVWNTLTFGHAAWVSGASEFLARLGGLTALALFFYFPPRIFYLIEDVNRPKTWLTMLLANSPVLFRVLIG